MIDHRIKVDTKKVDTKEFELPETLFVRDIENRVFQGIVLQCLSEIDGIGLVQGNLIDSIFNRGTPEGISGIVAEQDNKHQSVSIKIEVNIAYGVSIPEKAEEIQTKIADEITKITGLHVASVHVVFKNVLPVEQMQALTTALRAAGGASPARTASIEEEYNDEF